MSKSRSRLAADWFAKLRVNTETQEVEHEDVSDVKEEVDTSVSSELAALDSEKADLSYVTNAINSIDLSVKADVSYVDTKHETSYATATVGGSIKARISGSNLYITFNGNNA